MIDHTLLVLIEARLILYYFGSNILSYNSYKSPKNIESIYLISTE